MGYCMQMEDYNFHMKSDHFSDALLAIKNIMSNHSDMDGKEWSDGIVIDRWYAWVSTHSVLNANSIFEAFYAWRWEADTDQDGDISGIFFRGEKLGQDVIFFQAIAPYVTEGSYICMRGEDGSLWRWLFTEGRCIEQEGTVTY